MAKARRRKNSEFKTSVVKSVFLYGHPNKKKLSTLKEMEASFCSMVNGYINTLNNTSGYLLPLVKNDRKDPAMRRLEKQLRPKGVNSAFCQNAFDIAVTTLSNRLDSIRIDMMRYAQNVFVRSKILFAMALLGESRSAMIQAVEQIRASLKKENPFCTECIEALSSMTEEEFRFLVSELCDLFHTVSMEYRIPYLKSVSVPLDSRLMKIEPSVNTVYPYVIRITDPFHKNSRFTVPVNTSRHSLNKIRSSAMAGTVMMSVRNGNLRIGWSYGMSRKQPATSTLLGADTGISDALYLSDGRACGSMAEPVKFYHDTVEPAFAELSCLRNKKRNILHYLKNHDLPEDVRRSLIHKADVLEQMIRDNKSAYRKKRHYSQMLEKEISSTVKDYIHSIGHDTLTVVEKLDIREFNKSRKVNGMFSVFARGRLHEKLLSELNWYGYDYLEVVPDYTSQICPVCSCLDEKNRNGKSFVCTRCGHEDDADHNAAVNIRDRASDTEVSGICETYKYSHGKMQHALKMLYRERNETYQELHKAEPV